MPNTSSAKKALRQSERRRTRNLVRKQAVGNIVKQVRKLLTAGNTQEAAALLPRAYKAIDKAAKTHIIPKNTAARKKSVLARLTRLVQS